MATAPMTPGEKLQVGVLPPPEAPDGNVRSFLINEDVQPTHTDLSRNSTYAKYMRIHKVLVGNRGALQLEQIYDELKDEASPHYLSVAGWAAAESALVRSDLATEQRLSLLDKAVRVWGQAFIAQTELERSDEHDTDYGFMHRIALDRAVAPLLSGIIKGDVTREVCASTFENCLQVARSNIAYLHQAKQAGRIAEVGCRAGFGYECNALLAFNRQLSRTWFAIPTIARGDTGYYHGRQTHDLMVVHQKYGTILSATPVEIKSRASLRDRRRYSALLVRGKMHLSIEGKSKPEHTLAAIEAVHNGTADEEDYRAADTATGRFRTMVRDYYAGEVLGSIASKHSVTAFRDNTQVIARHPGLSKEPIAS